MMRKFYRVNHEQTQQGLWYDFDGQFTGLIHNEFSFCKNTGLAMDFDHEIVGYISAVEMLEQLFEWFPSEDIIRLQSKGFYIHEYESDDFKWYERFGHWVINREKSTVLRKIALSP